MTNPEVWDFPGGPAVKTSPSNIGVVAWIPGQGAKIPHASQPKNQSIKQKQHCNKFNKDFKNQIRSVAQLCPTLCDPMNRSTPGLPVHHPVH